VNKLKVYVKAVFALRGASRMPVLGAVLSQRAAGDPVSTNSEAPWTETALAWPPTLKTVAESAEWLLAANPGGPDAATLTVMRLPRALDVNIDLARVRLELVVSTLHLLPPWLRPSGTTRRHPLTKPYVEIALEDLRQRRLRAPLARRQAAWTLRNLVERCISETFGEGSGAGVFLRREV